MPIELIASNGPSARVAVVLEADFDLVAQAAFGHAFRGPVVLFARKGDTEHARPVLRGGMDRHPSQTAAHVEQLHT